MHETSETNPPTSQPILTNDQPLQDGNSDQSFQSVLPRLRRFNWLFVCTVILPTILAILYFGLIASEIYISESRFVIRSSERSASSSSVSSLLTMGTGASSSRDEYSVQDYILSRDALQNLDASLKFREIFTNPAIDFINRFPGIQWWRDSFEDLHLYYQNKIVTVEISTTSSISTLLVRAFSPGDALHINQLLLDKAETFVNQISERRRKDLISFASKEVTIAEEKAKTAAFVLSDYRNRKGVIDPEQQSSLQLQQVAKLQDELIATQAQLSHLQTFTKENPQIPSLQQRVANLRREIQTETDRVAGSDRSLAQKAAEYQRLALEREFADKQLASTLASLEQARNQAQRQQLYLERIAQPNTPDTAMEPRRIRGIATTLILGLVAWGILTMLIAGIKEHQD